MMVLQEVAHGEQNNALCIVNELHGQSAIRVTE